MAGLTAAFGLPYNSQLLLSGHSCCDSGTGQLPRSPQSTHVCSCQLEQVLQQKMNALPLGLFPRTNFSTDPNLIFGPTARESSAVYPPLVRQCDVKDITAGTINTAWFFNPRIDHHNFDRNRYPTCHRFGDRFSPIDLNSGARRKNATRETTSTLKAWLYEHRKNPYPTKGEKIMLAILTKMTLTQVSTWFANARRRLKKENKMTWSPRNRCGERKDSEGYSDDEDGDEDEEDNNDDLAEERENFSRKTTVIKTPQDINGFYRTDPVHSQLTSDVETLTPEQPRDQDLITPNRADQGVIWPSTRTAAETDKARTHHTISIEDSPVKSLRKWVDGCFDQNSAGTAHTPPTDTPPLTPPCATERLAEKVFHSAELEKPTPTIKNGSPQRDFEANLAQDTQRSNGQKEERTTNREIDAALALTTLFSRNHEHK